MGAGDVGASLEEPEIRGRQSVLSNPEDKLLRLQYIRFLQASESCLLGGMRKARTNVDLIVRILKQKERVWPDFSQGFASFLDLDCGGTAGGFEED